MYSILSVEEVERSPAIPKKCPLKTILCLIVVGFLVHSIHPNSSTISTSPSFDEASEIPSSPSDGVQNDGEVIPQSDIVPSENGQSEENTPDIIDVDDAIVHDVIDGDDYYTDDEYVENEKSDENIPEIIVDDTIDDTIDDAIDDVIDDVIDDAIDDAIDAMHPSESSSSKINPSENSDSDIDSNTFPTISNDNESEITPQSEIVPSENGQSEVDIPEIIDMNDDFVDDAIDDDDDNDDAFDDIYDEDELASSIGGPRSMVMNGCSGSSATYRFATKILEAHGVKVGWYWKSELMKPHKNPMYNDAEKKLKKEYKSGELLSEPTQDDFILEALTMMHENYTNHNEILFYKANMAYFYKARQMDNVFVDRFVEAKTRFSLLYRGNLLDHALCTIRDCFNTEDVGYPVFAENGTRTDLCFSRRRAGVKVKAFISDMDNFIAYLRSMERHRAKEMEDWKDIILPSVEQSMEDLLAYEYSDDEGVFDFSVKAWADFVRSMVDKVDESKIASLMRIDQNTRKPSSPHSEVIQNIDEVVDVIRNRMPSYVQYLRLDP